MKMISFITALALASVLLFCSPSRAKEFSFKDIVGSSPPKKAFRGARKSFSAAAASSGRGGRGGGGGGGGSPPNSKKQFLVIAQAKLPFTGKAHPSSPQVTVDVSPVIYGCRPFDWLFVPHCSGATPRSNVRLSKFSTVKLPRAFLHIFELPSGWKNARVKFASFGQCGKTRTANMRAARSGDRLCRTAQFRKPNRKTTQDCKRVSYRSCSFWRCKTKYRTVCKPRTVVTYTECSRTYFVIRVFTAVKTIPQVLATTGGIYSGFRSCSDAAAANYFTK